MRKQIHWESKVIFWSNVLQHSRSCPPQSKSSKRIDCYQHIQNDFSVTFFGIKSLQVRKKGRNKQHATNCRSRKENELKLLQVCKYSVNKSRLKCSFFRENFERKKKSSTKKSCWTPSCWRISARESGSMRCWSIGARRWSLGRSSGRRLKLPFQPQYSELPRNIKT